MRSLRSRLTVAAAIGVAVALALAGTLLVVRLQHTLVASVDATARQRVADVSELVRTGQLSARIPSASDEEVVEVRMADGELLAATVGRPADTPPLGGSDGDGPRTVSGATIRADGDSYRVVTGVTDGNDGPVRIAVAEASDDVADSIRTLVVLLAISLPAVLVVLVGFVWLLVGRALNPVETLRRQAAAVSVGERDQRVDVPRSTDELARLARTLNELLDRADVALRRERALVADAAHELRTPLAAMLTRLDIQQRYPVWSQAEERRSDEDLRAHVLRMARLVDGLLTLTRLEVRSPASDPVDLDDVVLAEMSDIRALGAARTPPVALRPVLAPARVRGDRILLARVVRNLLDNAVRHASSVVTVHLQICLQQAVLAVHDDGPGLPPGDVERIFERFARLDEGRSRDAGGTGLGLAIVREVVRQHGGEVAVDASAPGARFVVRLPADRDAAG